MHFLSLHNSSGEIQLYNFLLSKMNLYTFTTIIYIAVLTLTVITKNAMPQNKICIRLSPNRYKTIAT